MGATIYESYTSAAKTEVEVSINTRNSMYIKGHVTPMPPDTITPPGAMYFQHRAAQQAVMVQHTHTNMQESAQTAYIAQCATAQPQPEHISLLDKPLSLRIQETESRIEILRREEKSLRQRADNKHQELECYQEQLQGLKLGLAKSEGNGKQDPVTVLRPGKKLKKKNVKANLVRAMDEEDVIDGEGNSYDYSASASIPLSAYITSAPPGLDDEQSNTTPETETRAQSPGSNAISANRPRKSSFRARAERHHRHVAERDEVIRNLEEELARAKTILGLHRDAHIDINFTNVDRNRVLVEYIRLLGSDLKPVNAYVEFQKEENPELRIALLEAVGKQRLALMVCADNKHVRLRQLVENHTSDEADTIRRTGNFQIHFSNILVDAAHLTLGTISEAERKWFTRNYGERADRYVGSYENLLPLLNCHNMTELLNLRAEIAVEATAPAPRAYNVETFLNRQKECFDLFDTWYMAYGDGQAHVIFDSQAVIIQNLAAMRVIIQAVKDRRWQVTRAREAAQKSRASTAAEAAPARADRPRGNTTS